MASRNLGRGPGIGKRWPYKALNYLPSTQVWRYLTWKSEPPRPPVPFQLGKALSEARRILLVLPDDFQEILIAFPIMQCLVKGRPGVEFLFLADQALAGFVGALFGPDRVLARRPDEFHWGELHLQDLQRTLASFGPEVSLNLARETGPLMHYLVRASGAAIRIQASGDAPAPFANLNLRPSDPPNHLRRFLQVLRLWDLSETPMVPKWSRLAASPENLKDAFARLASKGVRPESTRLFLWQDARPSLQRDLFQAAVTERTGPGAAKSLVLVNGAGPLLATSPAPQDLAQGLPSLEADSIGLLLGLFAQTSRTLGVNGPLLQLAGIADTDVEAHYEPEDGVWDTAFLNPRLRVVYT